MTAQEALHVFGGKDRTQYLGCLNCSQYDDNSVQNKYGDYGSKYSDTSMHNKYGDYGGAYSEYSPCNKYTDTPPVVVDRSGGFYGALTLNRYHQNYNPKLGQITAILCADL